MSSRTLVINDTEKHEAVSLLKKINRKMKVIFPSHKPFPLTFQNTSQEMYMDIHTLHALLKNRMKDPPATFQLVFEHMYNRVKGNFEDMYSSTCTDSSDDDCLKNPMYIKENPFKMPLAPGRKSRRSRKIDMVARANLQLRTRRKRSR